MRSRRRLNRSLDLLNFLLADVRDGLGPYLSVYLLLAHHWDQAWIGFVMAVGGVGAIVAQAPAGALVDPTTAKRALVIAGALTITAGSLAMPLFPGFYSISVLQALTGLSGSVFAPALAAITLGVVGPRCFSRRIGRNESFNHAGNASAAAITGGLAYCFGPVAVFWVWPRKHSAAPHPGRDQHHSFVKPASASPSDFGFYFPVRRVRGGQDGHAHPKGVP